MSKIYSNIVSENKVREKQKETLQIIADALTKSFGPKGSTTAIVKNMDKNGVNISLDYTKDGHTIVKSIAFEYPIERSVQDILTELTRYVVKEVGDGTTSAILICNSVFKCLCDNNVFDKGLPADIIVKFNEVINEVNKRILDKGKECTLDDIYNIALIATNNNEELSKTLYQVYKKYGLDVYIDVSTSNEIDNVLKEYDGMTLDTGFTDICFVNDKKNNSARVMHPKIYAFQDPIDTPEMLTFLDAILQHNILRAYEPRSVYEPIPTVILCKALSPDNSSYFETIVRLMNSCENVPLLFVSDIRQEDIYEDIAKMCGCKVIKKYIDPEIQQKEIEAGLAPTPETVIDFCGEADMVEADQYKTKFVNPSKMLDENGEYSEEYKTMLTYLETQVEKAKNEGETITKISNAKRRLNAFKGCMVDFLVGGITTSDKINLKAAAEDAVLNCRSAVKDGVGCGANFMALQVLHEMKEEQDFNNTFVDILYDAYVEVYKILYGEGYEDVVKGSLENGCPLNIRTNEYDHKVVSSIRSDVCILETISKILTLMFTTNQYLVQAPVYNVYCADEK